MIDRFENNYGFLSNFYTSSVEFEGIEYPSVEHAYQAAKSLDPEFRQKMSVCPHPAKAKKMGRTVNLRPDWEEVKIQIMKELVRKKFQNEYLRGRLLETGDEPLIEGNWWHDTFWGCEMVDGQWKGQNHLGKILMQVRSEIAGK